MTIPVWFQDWYNNGSGGIAAAAQTYIDRVEADGGAVESIGCVPSAVWDWTAPSFIGLLDLFPNAAAAYSLRKLRAAYSGSAVRVRKEVSTVSSETDIGFLADGTLDTVSLLAFASDADSGDVFVVTWYDQSLSNDATQSTGADQPKIVSGGSLVLESGKPAIEMFKKSLNISLDISGYSSASVFMCHHAKYETGDDDIFTPFRLSTSGTSYFKLNNGNAFEGTFIGSRVSFNSGVLDDTLNITSIIHDGSARKFYNNGGFKKTDTAAYNGATSLRFEGVDESKNFEMILYSSDQSTNRTAIETNINTFYSIYP